MTQWQPQYEPGRPGVPTPPQWQQQPYQQPPSYGPPSPQPPRRSRKGITCLGCLGAVFLAGIIAAVAGSHSATSTPPPLAAVSTQGTAPAQAAAPATTAAQTAAAKPVQVAAFSGSDTEKTATFTVTASWALSYAFDCSSFGQSGNFQVFTDGGSDFNGVTVNDLAESKSSVTYAYNDAGTHYLEVNSECSWSVKVYDEG